LIDRGIPAEKIDLAPNGVDLQAFQPLAPDVELIAKHGLNGRTVIGFIGSFYFYEGLRYLVEAVEMLLNERRKVSLLLVGEGEAEAELRALVPPHLREHFILTGKIPHEQVRRYYSVMQILVYPRVKSRLTELTTPLKPLEAMAMARTVVGSRVGGISELIRDNETGLLVESENAGALAAVLARLIDNPGMQTVIAAAARDFVIKERDWMRIVEQYPEIYNRSARESRGSIG
jgi:glycosyltransferase involved in cell wall biosynthesis